jgi:hypothetical protein
MAAIAQTPNVDGLATTRNAARYQTLALLRLTGRGVLDPLGGLIGSPPLLVPLAARRRLSRSSPHRTPRTATRGHETALDVELTFLRKHLLGSDHGAVPSRTPAPLPVERLPR